ncbi:DNA repair protein RadA [Desulfotomaculum copahuensis]|uniref:DNA repair protein RadA n=1 Tax=Desulfotomaculum copahuensis TaxID=1838280 RepID=A0A1B7LGG0_9FIRM|nr:DNA repair protein RadA [Desulfotomaculum copahuensis]OAT85185.1 DNA repair protein RadA [Desulfotomaculum copahuensis]
MAVKTRFYCQECGHVSPRWLGRCPDCGAWNSLVEEKLSPAPKSAPASGGTPVQPVTAVPGVREERFPTGLAELDRVLGGGVVPASLVLLGGDPGIGKSTLLLQMAHLMSAGQKPVLYVSGEESVSQVRMRAGRLGAGNPLLYLLAETDVERIAACVESLRPALVVVDSIQTIHRADLGSAPGSVGQVRECGARLMRLAKEGGAAVFLVGHVTKEGQLAGPRVLEHMVDTVLYFEGERHQSYRILRAVKNRFGSTNEIGVFEMQHCGLVEVPNPSALFTMHQRTAPVAGAAVVSALEGTRPLLVEIQALVSPTGFGMPRRMAAGVDYNRVALIMAVLEKRVGLHLGSHDAYVSAVGGVRLDEPAADLGVALALASSFRDRPVAEGTVVAGEIGLTGEIRPVSGVDRRVQEASRMGFKQCILPRGNLVQINGSGSLKIAGVETLAQAVELALSR